MSLLIPSTTWNINFENLRIVSYATNFCDGCQNTSKYL